MFVLVVVSGMKPQMLDVERSQHRNWGHHSAVPPAMDMTKIYLLVQICQNIKTRSMHQQGLLTECSRNLEGSTMLAPLLTSISMSGICCLERQRLFVPSNDLLSTPCRLPS